MAFPTYTEIRRSKGGILKGLYDQVKNLADGILPVGSISTSEIADNAVTGPKINYFKSTEQTGDGSEQDIAHGLGSVPSIVLVIPSINKDGADCSFVEGTHGTANVKVTATSGAKYKVFAVK